jgi:hypothetical protein
MAKTERKRIVIEIPQNNPRYQRIRDHVTGSDIAKKNILDVYDAHYYPRSLVEDGAEPLKILMAATSSANQLYYQIQELVELLQSAGIQAPPAMLAQAGITGYQSGAAISPIKSSESAPSGEFDSLEEDDDDNWGEIPPLTAAELALVKESETELGVKFNG